MVAPPAHPELADAADADSRRCIGCDYLLSGLPRDAACPECGTSVAHSAAPLRLLRNQDAGWLGRLAEGLLWQVVANAGFLTLSVLDQFTRWRYAHDPAEGHFPLPVLVHLLVLGLNLFAVWRITTPEPGVVEPRWSLRRTARVLASLVPVFLVGLALAAQSLTRYWAFMLAAALIGLGNTMVWFAYVRRLTLRLPDPGLAFESLLLLCGWGVTLAFTAVLPYLGRTLLDMGVNVGDVYHFGAGIEWYVRVALLTFWCYFCFRLRREILAARAVAAKSRTAGEAAVAG